MLAVWGYMKFTWSNSINLTLTLTITLDVYNTGPCKLHVSRRVHG